MPTPRRAMPSPRFPLRSSGFREKRLRARCADRALREWRIGTSSPLLHHQIVVYISHLVRRSPSMSRRSAQMTPSPRSRAVRPSVYRQSIVPAVQLLGPLRGRLRTLSPPEFLGFLPGRDALCRPPGRAGGAVVTARAPNGVLGPVWAPNRHRWPVAPPSARAPLHWRGGVRGSMAGSVGPRWATRRLGRAARPRAA